MTQIVKATHVGSGIDIDDIAIPGCFQYQDMSFKPLDSVETVAIGEKVRIAFYDPMGNRGAVVAVRQADSEWWQWDGNEYLPTIIPSIENTGYAGKWHGYLTKGEWVQI